MAHAVFAVSLAACLYLYFGYPALILLLSRLRPRPVSRAPVRPSVTMIVPAHNEEGIIAEKIQNARALRYPNHLLEVLVVSDGSTDSTNEIVHRHEGAGVSLVPIERQGKAAALNEGARRARGEVLVFSDANAMLEPDCLMYLVESFADPEVGGVCGNKRLRSPGRIPVVEVSNPDRTGAAPGDTTKEGENLYLRYDKWQKQLESRIGSIFAADGTLYAVRKELYMQISDPAQADDIAISARVVLQGRRLLFEPRAVVWEDAPLEGREEFRRKIRVTNHSVRALWNLGRALWTTGFYSVELLSHKFFRHLAPFFLIPLFAASAVLRDEHPLFWTFWVLQVLFYAAAGVGLLLRHTRAGRLRVLSVPYYFCLVNAAALLGVLSILAGTRQRAWNPRSGFRAGLTIAFLTLALDAAAQPEQKLTEAQVSFNSVTYGNFFQMPHGQPARNVWARALEVRVSRRMEERPRTSAYGDFDLVSYREFGPSGGLAGGVSHDGQIHGFDLAARMQWNRPVVEVRDEFGRADIAGFGGVYSYRATREVELAALGDFRHESYEVAQTKNNNAYYGGGALRYYGFGRQFSPEVGLTLGRRNTVDDNEDFGQRELFVRVRSAVSPRVYLSSRYRHRLRTYSIEDARRSNFDRVDRRHQLNGSADVTVVRQIIAHVYYAHESSGSTRSELDFATNTLSLGVTVRF